jgi:hypothetical protein
MTMRSGNDGELPVKITSFAICFIGGSSMLEVWELLVHSLQEIPLKLPSSTHHFRAKPYLINPNHRSFSNFLRKVRLGDGDGETSARLHQKIPPIKTPHGK